VKINVITINQSLAYVIVIDVLCNIIGLRKN